MLAARRAKAVSKKLPREVLRDLLNRSGLSVAEVARLAGYSSTSGLHKYITDAQGDKLIPYGVIKKLMPIMAGRGTPPIKNEELLVICAVQDYPAQPEPTPKLGLVQPRGLSVRYRAERGVYMDDASRRARKYGESVILPSVNYPEHAQWAVVDADAPRPTTLQCVDLDEVPAHRRAGRRCVCKVERERSGLYEVIVSTFRPDGKPENGTPLGVVVGAFVEE